MNNENLKSDLLKKFNDSINKFSLIFKEKDCEIKYQKERHYNTERETVLCFVLLLFGFFLSGLKVIQMYFSKKHEINPSQGRVPMEINLVNFLIIIFVIILEIIIFFY